LRLVAGDGSEASERLKGLPFRSDASESSLRCFSENFFKVHLKRSSLEVIVLSRS
jgi:hypothetical protein